MSTITATSTFTHSAVRPLRPARTPGPTAPATQGEVRLTRRGRLVVFTLALLVILGLGLFWAAGSVATDEPGTPEPTRVMMVGSGDTLWGIASELAEDGDVRGMVDHIERLNALDSAMVSAGQRIRVPAAG